MPPPCSSPCRRHRGGWRCSGRCSRSRQRGCGVDGGKQPGGWEGLGVPSTLPGSTHPGGTLPGVWGWPINPRGCCQLPAVTATRGQCPLGRPRGAPQPGWGNSCSDGAFLGGSGGGCLGHPPLPMAGLQVPPASGQCHPPGRRVCPSPAMSLSLVMSPSPIHVPQPHDVPHPLQCPPAPRCSPSPAISPSPKMFPTPFDVPHPN